MFKQHDIPTNAKISPTFGKVRSFPNIIRFTEFNLPMLGLLLSAVQAVAITVTNTSDNGTGSLRQAITSAVNCQ